MPIRPPGREPIFGRYQILNPISDDPTLYRARDLRLGQIVAIRFLESPGPILGDIRAAARVRHPNVAAVIDAKAAGGFAGLVWEYAEGINLQQAIHQRGPMPVAEALDLLIQAARGLAAAHERQVFHGALKPSQWRLDPAGTLRLTGLGGSRLTIPMELRADVDIGRLGGLLHFLLIGREPFPMASPDDRWSPATDRPAPEIRIHRPDLPSPLVDAYRKLMAPRPEDRPQSMADVVAMLESCRLAISGDRPKPTTIGPEFDLSGLGIESGSASSPLTTPNHPIGPPLRGHGRKVAGLSVGAALAMLAIIGLIVSRRPTPIPPEAPIKGPAKTTPAPPPAPVFGEPRTLYAGPADAPRWMLASRRPVPGKNVQPDGLNPHGSGSYLVAYRQKLGDFILDLDYRLAPGGDSGVFVRVGNLDDPMRTGLEISINDKDGTGLDAPGAIRRMVGTSTNARKPAGQWNHLTITAIGPTIAVSLNGRAVSRIQLDEWTTPGRRPDGTPHDWPGLDPARLPRTGFLGFQDLVGDCWFQNVLVKTPPPRRDESRRPDLGE